LLSRERIQENTIRRLQNQPVQRRQVLRPAPGKNPRRRAGTKAATEYPLKVARFYLRVSTDDQNLARQAMKTGNEQYAETE
jgi:hypothetical protein